MIDMKHSLGILDPSLRQNRKTVAEYAGIRFLVAACVVWGSVWIDGASVGHLKKIKRLMRTFVPAPFKRFLLKKSNL